MLLLLLVDFGKDRKREKERERGEESSCAVCHGVLEYRWGMSGFDMRFSVRLCSITVIRTVDNALVLVGVG